ncbi:MAG: hypothetical protein ACRD1M_05050 [Terriglobales bacterium]
MAEVSSLPSLLSRLPALLDLTPEPAAAQAALTRLLAAASSAVRRAFETDAGLLPSVLVLLGSSDFLAEALIQSPDLLLWLQSERRHPRPRPREQWAAALAGFTSVLPELERPLGLIRFKRREYLRIALRDLQAEAGLAETTQELSDLADALLQQAFSWAWNALVGRFGIPQQPDGRSADLAVLALGKLGGGELNYSSDIDLIFLYSADGWTGGGREAASNKEFFTRMAQAITHFVSAVTSEGLAYRVDLRLRPGGREGEIAVPLAQALEYYHRQARPWELQMLTRARICAGSRVLAQAFLAPLAAAVYPSLPDGVGIAAAIHGSRMALNDSLRNQRARRPGLAALDVKLDPGGIRDIEFLAQFLQRRHGGAAPWLRTGNTLIALQRLQDHHVISAAEWQQLSAAYLLLRHTEHRIQLRRGQQLHGLPVAPDRLAALARSLRAVAPATALTAGSGGNRDILGLLHDHMDAVSALWRRYLEPPAAEHTATAPVAPAPEPASSPPTLAPEDVAAHGQRQWQRFQRSLAALPDAPRPAPPLLSRLRRSIQSSDWMAETLIRRPRLLSALDPMSPNPAWPAPSQTPEAMASLRLWHQQQTLKLLAEEWEVRRPIAATLRLHSDLAVGIMRRALEYAHSAAPAAPSFAVLALGRLGLAELDLLSDLDLVFLAAGPELEAANRLAARFIGFLSDYTQQGNLYNVDTRLRPGGGEGELVQTPAAVRAYFHSQANVWEALSYLKARPVAGDRLTAGNALAGVYDALSTRFRSYLATPAARVELAALRQRIANAGHPGRWGLKTGAGGYYDVDFLFSPRLIAAGRVSAGAGGLAAAVRSLLLLAQSSSGNQALPPAAASELADLVSLLRAADHALRVVTGSAGAAIPSAGPSVERCWVWLCRIHPHPIQLPWNSDRIASVRDRVHAIYEQWR